jgi:hypothetical protein
VLDRIGLGSRDLRGSRLSSSRRSRNGLRRRLNRWKFGGRDRLLFGLWLRYMNLLDFGGSTRFAVLQPNV